LGGGELSESSLAEGKGLLGNVAMTLGDLAINKGIPFLAKRGRSWPILHLRSHAESRVTKKAINCELNKGRPALEKVGSELLDQVSKTDWPKKRYRIDRPELKGAGLDIYSVIGKLSAPKRGWTLTNHNYTGPYYPLDQQLK